MHRIIRHFGEVNIVGELSGAPNAVNSQQRRCEWKQKSSKMKMDCLSAGELSEVQHIERTIEGAHWGCALRVLIEGAHRRCPSKVHYIFMCINMCKLCRPMCNRPVVCHLFAWRLPTEVTWSRLESQLEITRTASLAIVYLSGWTPVGASSRRASLPLAPFSSAHASFGVRSQSKVWT